MKFRFILPVAIAMLAGAAHADTPQDKANEAAVAGFYAGLDQADAEGLQGSARLAFIEKLCDQYIAPGYIQHSSMGGGNGREALAQMLGGGMRMKMPPAQAKPAGPKMGPATVLVLAADGNYVVRISERTINGKSTLVWNMFRMEDGLLAEHWDAMSGAPEGPGAGAGGPPPGAAPPGGAPPPPGAPGG
jgi:predicted SnoaL-like aldol condensation-catalyzing enzyme